MIAYVNEELFPYLHGFKQKADERHTIEYKIGEIFGEIKNKFSSGYSLRDALELIDAASASRSQAEKHELSHLYEAKIKNMGNAGRNGGEYYTPRPLIRAMIKVIKPQDRRSGFMRWSCAGQPGFLCESRTFSCTTEKRSRPRILQYAPNPDLLSGKEKKSLAYVIAIM